MSATYYHLYVHTSCAVCKKACDLLNKKGKEYILTALDRSSLVERAMKRKYKQETVPIILEVKADTMEIMEEGEKSPQLDLIKIAETNLIGGYAELEERLTKQRRSLLVLPM